MTHTLILVRHGQTTANAEGRLLGRADVDLTDAGREQVRALAALLTSLPVRRVVSSPLVRAVETAKALGLPVDVDDRWVEMDYGGLDQQRLRDLPASLWDQWRADPSFRPPGGESLLDVARRVGQACDEIARDPGEGAVVVVSHVSPIKAAVAWALGAGPETTWRMFLDLASLSRVAIRPGAHPVLQTFNETPWRTTANRS